MKKVFVFGLLILLLAGLLSAACKSNGGEDKNDETSPQTGTGNGDEVTVGDFILTISAENTTVKQGENFKVNVELKNNSGEDKEIIYSVLFWPHIPNWEQYRCGCEKGCQGECGIRVEIEWPEPRLALFEADGVLRSTGWVIRSNELGSGTHDLRFFARFGVFWSEDNPEPIEVWSNTIKLTVR